MQIFESIASAQSIKNPIITLGTFDGVHLGHQFVLQQLNDLAHIYNGESTLLTFEPHPRIVLQGVNHGIQLIQTFDEKKKKLEKFGLQNLICIPFTKEFGDQSAEEFVKNILVDTLNIRAIVIGHDHRFGKDRLGNFELLFALGDKYNFEVLQTTAFSKNETLISSTKIRAALSLGELEKANDLLNGNFELTGFVTEGEAIGRTLGFPTANITIEDETKLIPQNGVYAVSVTFPDQRLYYGVVNIGIRPTINDQKKKTIEVHIFDFDLDIYNQSLTLHFFKKIRDEQQFLSVDLLKAQIAADSELVRNFFKSNPSAVTD